MKKLSYYCKYQDFTFSWETKLHLNNIHVSLYFVQSMYEVITSEMSYLRSLRVLTEHFMESSELNDTLIIMDKKTLFSNILRIQEVSERWVPVCVKFTVITVQICWNITSWWTPHISFVCLHEPQRLYLRYAFARCNPSEFAEAAAFDINEMNPTRKPLNTNLRINTSTNSLMLQCSL